VAGKRGLFAAVALAILVAIGIYASRAPRRDAGGAAARERDAVTRSAERAGAEDRAPRAPAEAPGSPATPTADRDAAPGVPGLPAPTRFLGRVVAAAAAGDRPVADAIVRIVADGDEPILEAAPDAAGDFRIEIGGPLPDGIRVRVAARGFVPAERSGPFAAHEDNDLGRIELAPGRRIFGRVLDDAGRPLRATVTLSRDAGGERPFVTLVEFVDVILAHAPAIASAATDASGRFELDGLETGRYAIRAAAPGREDGIADDIEISPRAPAAERDLRLGPGASIDGRIVHADGAPAAGVRVIALLAGDGWPPPDRTFAATTDDDGRYEIRGAPPARMSVIVPREDGEIALSRQVLPPVRGLDFTLEPPVRVEGVVRDRATGEPIAGAQLFGITQDLSVAVARAGSDGRFRLALARGDGETTLVASAAGYADRNLAIGATSSPEPIDCTIELDRGAEVRGTVVRADDGSPVRGATVVASASGIGDGALARVLTDETGGFAVTAPPGKVRLFVDAPGGLAQDAARTPLEITLDPASPSEPVTIALVAAARLVVRVRTPAGEPAAGARVELLGARGPAGSPRIADGEGAVEIEALAAGSVVTAFAEARDGAIGFSEATTAETAASRDTIVVLSPAAHCRGRVVDAVTGAGLSGAVVMVEPRRIAGRPDLAGPVAGALLARRARRSVTDEGGRFDVTGLVPGVADVSATAADHSFVRRTDVAVGSDEREVEIALSPGTEIRGRVTEPGGSAIAGAWISIEAPGAPPFVLRSTEDGSFASESAPPPPFTLRVSALGHREHSRPISSEDQLSNDLAIELPAFR